MTHYLHFPNAGGAFLFILSLNNKLLQGTFPIRVRNSQTDLIINEINLLP
jgi:hypothetical protein